MIIPGNALLALLSSPQESQSTREEGSGFGALLTESEQHATSLPDQKEAERRALESVLQVLMSLFQSCTPAHCLSAASASGTGESGPVSIRPAAGLPLGLPPGLGTAPGLGDMGGIDLPPGIVSDGSHDIGQLAFPALDGQGTGPFPAAAGAPGNFSWLLHRQERMQNVSGLFMARPTAGLETPSSAPSPDAIPSFSRDSVLATAEAQFGSPELPPPRFSPPSLPSPARGEAEKSHAVAIGEHVRVDINPTPPLVGPALTTQPLRAGEEVFQSPSTTLPPTPGHAAPAAPWAVQATAPLTEAAVPLPTAPQTEVAAMSAALWPRALASEDAALSEPDTSPTFRPLPKSQERAAATVPSVAPSAPDSALPLVSVRATSHIPSAEPAIADPPSHSLEDMGRPWPRPLPANTVVLHLEPRELGALLLQVRVNDKRLITSFQAQSPETETLLRTHLPSLHESLSQHGFEVQPIAISLTAEGFNAHMGAGTGAFAHQHSAFQAFAQDQQTASTREMQSEGDLHRTPRRPTEQKPRLLDVVI